MNRYRLVREIGHGGAGKVYEAHAVDAFGLELPVALKVLDRSDDDTLRRFAREARASRLLNHAHPHLVTTFDYGWGVLEGKRCLFLAMELTEGSIRDLDGMLPIPVVRAIARDATAALAHLHAAGMLHRDVSIGNLMFTRHGRILLGDLGLARGVDAPHTNQMFCGTVCFAPPEALVGGRVTPSSDLFSLGSVLFELLTDAPPFGVGTTAQVYARMMVQTPSLPEGIPDELADYVMGLLATDAANRPFPSAVEAFASLPVLAGADELADAREAVRQLAASRLSSAHATAPLDLVLYVESSEQSSPADVVELLEDPDEPDETTQRRAVASSFPDELPASRPRLLRWATAAIPLVAASCIGALLGLSLSPHEPHEREATQAALSTTSPTNDESAIEGFARPDPVPIDREQPSSERNSKHDPPPKQHAREIALQVDRDDIYWKAHPSRPGGGVMYTRPRWRGDTLIFNVKAEPPFALAEAYLGKDRGKLRHEPGDLGGDAVQLEFPNAKALKTSKKTARIVLSEKAGAHWMILYLEAP